MAERIQSKETNSHKLSVNYTHQHHDANTYDSFTLVWYRGGLLDCGILFRVDRAHQSTSMLEPLSVDVARD